MKAIPTQTVTQYVLDKIDMAIEANTETVRPGKDPERLMFNAGKVESLKQLREELMRTPHPPKDKEFYNPYSLK